MKKKNATPTKRIVTKHTSKFRLVQGIFEKGIIPLGLFVLWIVISLFFNSEVGFSVLTYNEGAHDFIQIHTNELLAHQTVKGEFTAQENNVGIVSVRFNTYIRINSDIVIFRIKPNNAQTWYYQNSYKVDQFQPNQLFTFGFPLIKNSKGKIYDFEIESTKGKPGDAVSISPIQPIFVTKYQFPRSALLHDRKLLAYFLYKKLLNSFTNIIFLVYSLSYLLPLLFYLLIKLSYKKYVLASFLLSCPFLVFIGRAIVTNRQLPIVSNLLFIGVFVLLILNIIPLLLTKESKYTISRYVISFVFFISFVINIFILPDPNNFLYVMFFLYWILLIKIFVLDSSFTLFAAIIFLALCPIFRLGNMWLNAEKAADLCYLFLIIAVIQMMYELRSGKPNLKGIYLIFKKI